MKERTIFRTREEMLDALRLAETLEPGEISGRLEKFCADMKARLQDKKAVNVKGIALYGCMVNEEGKMAGNFYADGSMPVEAIERDFADCFMEAEKRQGGNYEQ